MEYKTRMDAYREAVESYLQGCFADESLPQKLLFDAMRYSLLAGGKRIRPVLALEFCRICGGEWEKALPFAAAVEMVHTYSLIHDDLPCMDNDDYRRGRLTNHKVFGEATAVLAGDALLTAAFDTMAHADAPAQTVAAAIGVLASAAGEKGMVGGQILDMEGEHRALDENAVYAIHSLKTGALISAACRVGAIAGGANEAQIKAAQVYAESLGLAFQIRDDMLDVLGDAEKMGKNTGKDTEKNTFVRIYGVGECSKMVQRYTDRAIDALECFDDSEFLIQTAKRLALREY
ncbi:MAG: polyprenyl synthetase family protein [Oscillospiraceae bacterium]|nr:polyprenyl synthetase family protein [Oscillospiraceae bacterium]